MDEIDKTQGKNDKANTTVTHINSIYRNKYGDWTMASEWKCRV